MYGMRIYSNAQYLDSNFTEEYIVNLFFQHFDQDMEVLMTLYQFGDVETLCQSLVRNTD